MRLKTITVLSVILNLVLLGWLGYVSYKSAKSNEVIQQKDVQYANTVDATDNFDSEFYDRVATQNTQIQNLLLLSDNKGLSDATKNIIAKNQPFSDNLQLRSKNCVALKDKRSFKIELGKLSVKVKDGEPADVEGLTISRANADLLLSQIFVYDKAIVNICLQLEKVQPNSDNDRKFILDLLDRQQSVVASYEKFKLQISQANTEGDVVKALKDNKASADSLSKKNETDSSNTKKAP